MPATTYLTAVIQLIAKHLVGNYFHHDVSDLWFQRSTCNHALRSEGVCGSAGKGSIQQKFLSRLHTSNKKQLLTLCALAMATRR
jgi:hypothetical protein